MSATIKIEERSYRDFQRKIGRLETVVIDWTYEAMIKFLTNAQTLAKNKLKSDGHIVTNRLRNSIYVKERTRKNEGSYTADGKSYNNKLEIQLNDNEAAVGTNVEYASAIEFGYGPRTITAKNGGLLKFKINGQWISKKSVKHPGFKGDSFLYWGVKNSNAEQMGRDISEKLLGFRE